MARMHAIVDEGGTDITFNQVFTAAIGSVGMVTLAVGVPPV